MIETRPDLGVTEMVAVPSSVEQRADLLHGNYRFASLRLPDFTAREIEALARYTELFRAAASTVIFEEGAREAYMAFLVSGEVEIRKTDGHGGTHVLTTFGPGKLLGEMSLVDGETRSASAVALRESTLLVLTEAEFERLVDELPRLGAKLALSLARLLSGRLRMTSGRLVDHLG